MLRPVVLGNRKSTCPVANDGPQHGALTELSVCSGGPSTSPVTPRGPPLTFSSTTTLPLFLGRGSISVLAVSSRVDRRARVILGDRVLRDDVGVPSGTLGRPWVREIAEGLYIGKP